MEETMNRVTFVSLLASTVMAGAATLATVHSARAQGTVVEFVGPCFDDAAKEKQRELLMHRDHSQHMLDAERHSIATHEQLAQDLEYIRQGADSWPAGFQQADIDKLMKKISDLELDIQWSNDHIVSLQSTLQVIG
jgi:peptidoglycan hydrolase CwlO-like protein